MRLTGAKEARTQMTPKQFVRRKQFVGAGPARVAYVRFGPPEDVKRRAPLLFVHGIPTSSFVWRHILEAVAAEGRVAYAPDLMGLGDTEVSPEEDFRMPAQAQMLEGFCASLGLERVHLVIHDQGGACGQIFATSHPERIASLTLTDCVAYDNWPVPVVRTLMAAARVPGSHNLFRESWLFNWFMGSRFAMGRGVSDRSVLTEEVVSEYIRPLAASGERRRRARRFLLAGDNRYTRDVVPKLRQFDRPTGIIWADADPFLPLKWAERLREDIPGVRYFKTIPDASHFFQEDRPAEFTKLLLEWLGQAENSSGGE